ncbi:MAG: ATPase, T2SS/T4P/T4SS family [Candidatus Hydrogenedentota bacterium]
MATIIAGIGQQKSFQAVIDVAEEEMGKTEGKPRRIKGRSDSVDFTIDRTEFDTKFERYKFRIEANGNTLQRIHDAADAAPDGICEYVYNEDENQTTFTLPCENASDVDYEVVRATVETICKHIRIPEIWRFDGSEYDTTPPSIELLFRALIQYKASDIHLSPGMKPIFRIDNEMLVSDLMPPLSGPQIYALIKQLSPDEAWEHFLKDHQNSFGFHQKGIGYARTSAFMKAGQPHLTFRYHPETIPSFDDLNMPSDIMGELAKLHNGLVCIVGNTGCGKSSTNAALLDWINTNRKLHILTLEDPVEYHHHNKKSIVSQRNMGTDVSAFDIGVEGALRHDPDVILVGEMRDAGTIRAAIGAAATGHLVLTTLHASNASSVIDRICSFFDPIERELVRSQLCECIRVVICQLLVEKKGGGRVPALEVMFNDVKQISKSIIEGNTNGIRLGMQQTLSKSQLFEHYLYDRWKEDLITLETAQLHAPDLSMFEQIRMGTYTVPKLA